MMREEMKKKRKQEVVTINKLMYMLKVENTLCKVANKQMKMCVDMICYSINDM